MIEEKKINKGMMLEEILRLYFLRSGFFVVRGVPFKFSGEDLTDVDLWLYERPTGTTRRVQICDIKYKKSPKAIERIFWTAGLAKILQTDGAYVATTDKRKNLRPVAKKLGIQIIDGLDLDRIKRSFTVSKQNRISNEDFLCLLQHVDTEYKNRKFYNIYMDILTTISDGFGTLSAVRNLDIFRHLASDIVAYPPNSKIVSVSLRLAYLAAAIVCESLDYISIGAAFRPIEEKKAIILEAIRFGALNKSSLNLALSLIEKYSPAGSSASLVIKKALKNDLNKIPAEIIAEQAIRLLSGENNLFTVGKNLEEAAYRLDPPSFDALDINSKCMIAAFLDYAGINRDQFVKVWKYEEKETLFQRDKSTGEKQKTLF